MRVFVTAAISTFAFVGLACASTFQFASPFNQYVSSNYGNVTVGGTTFGPTNAIDGNNAATDEWLGGYGGVTNGTPYLFLNLGQAYNVDSITIQGTGNAGNVTKFDIFVGTVANMQAIETGGLTAATNLGITPILSTTTQMGGSPWSLTATVSPSTPIQGILYYALGNPGQTIAGVTQDIAYVTEIGVDVTPEPATVGLMGLSLLLLGFVRRPNR